MSTRSDQQPGERRLARRRAIAAAVVSGIVPAVGQANVGRVDFAFGDVTGVDKAGKERAIRKGTILREGDTIRTERGRAQIRFSDGSRTALLPNTEFRVDEYEFEGKESETSRSFFSLLKGGLRTVTGAIGRLRKRSYRLNTPVATIGIRGTEYLVKLGNSGDIYVGKGGTTVSNDAGEYFCAGRCYVPNQGVPVFYAEDHPIYTAPPLTHPKLKEKPGASDDAFDLAGDYVTLPSPTGSGSPEPIQMTSGRFYVVGVASGDDTEGVSIFPPEDGVDELVDVTFGSPTKRYEAEFSDGVTSYERITSESVDSGFVGTTAAGGVMSWTRWTPGMIRETFTDSSCSVGPCLPETRDFETLSSTHLISIIPPADGETLPPDRLLTFSLIGATTPTLRGDAFLDRGVDGVFGGTAKLDTGVMEVQISDMRVVAGGGSYNLELQSRWMNVDPARQHTFGAFDFRNGTAIDLDGGSSSASYGVRFAGGISTGASHVGTVYQVDTGKDGPISGSAAFQQVRNEPAPPQLRAQ
jgi:hypothetical protein